MQPTTIPQITRHLQLLSAEKLDVVYDFVSFLLERQPEQQENTEDSDIFQTMLVSEAVLRQDWERDEEERAWANL